MNIDELLKGGKVEWKTLGEALVRTRGTKITAGQMERLHKENAPIRVFAGGKTFADVDYGDIPDKDVQTETSIIVKSRGNIGFEYYEKPFSHKAEFWAYHSENEKVNLKFVYYYIQNNDKYFQELGSKMSKMPQISSRDTDEFKIPIPPIEVQEKIVKTLDNFTNYVKELTAELKLRNQQYAFYRDMLLSEKYLQKLSETLIITANSEQRTANSEQRTANSEQRTANSEQRTASSVSRRINFSDITEISVSRNTIIWTTLAEVVQYQKKRISFEELDEENYVGVDNLLQDKKGKKNSSYVPMEGNFIKFEKGDILIGNIRPYLRKIWKSDKVGGTNGDVLALQIKDESSTLISSDYLYQVLADERFFDYDIKHSKGAKMPRGDKQAVLNYKFPLPSLAVQAHVVSNLDKFDTLINDLSQGLPREIELRKKQYEYYRERLLSFE